jgi:glycine/D-amino acid oxidase-like deaminating enzyme
VLAREVVHSRAPDAQQKLKDAHVVLVGVGALGSSLAVQLARAGVGRLTLIDPDALEAGNLGRHVLGTRHLGESKAEALRQQLLGDVPTVRVNAITGYVQIEKDVEKALDSATLVLVSSADWLSELWLWERKAEGALWPLVQVWSEPHAFVGHALVSPAQSPDNPRPLFDNIGEFRYAFSKWPNGGVVHQPACGDSYIPGGPIALGAIAMMGAQAAIDVLAGDIAAARWYSLVSRDSVIEAAGGTYEGPKLADEVVSQVLVRAWPAQSGDAS